MAIKTRRVFARAGLHPGDISVAGRCGIAHEVFRQEVLGMLRAAFVQRAKLSFVFFGDRRMRILNRRILGHDYTTDVITFDLSEPGVAGAGSGFIAARHSHSIDGEIYICPDEARRNAVSLGEPIRREILRCAAHGILHLLGYDDANDSQREQMHHQEDRLLR